MPPIETPRRAQTVRASTTVAEQERYDRLATQAETALGQLTTDYARGMIPDGAYTAARVTLEAERDNAARNAAQLRSAHVATAARGALAVDLLTAWEVLPDAARNRVLRQLCAVRVTRGAWRSEVEVLGLWEPPV